MPNKKSAKKELRKSAKLKVANKKVSDTMKKAVKTNLKQVQASDKKVLADLPKTIKAIDKAAKKGVIKKQAADRKKSRLMKTVNTIK